jgi:hypothetical protein
MPLTDPTYLAACLLIPLGFFLGSALGFLLHRARFSSGLRPGRTALQHLGCRRCQYCHEREAVLFDETIRVQAGEMVETKCFVCGKCGLPQWVVTRSKVMGPASR